MTAHYVTPRNAPDAEGSRREMRGETLNTGNALTAADNAFRFLVTGLAPLTIDGTDIGHGLPSRPVDLAELRDMLTASAADDALKDAVWRELVHRTRHDGPAWVIGCMGVAMPALKLLAGKVRRTAPPGLGDDIVSELVTEFVAQLARIDTTRPCVFARLIVWARRSALRVRSREARYLPVDPAELAPLTRHPEPDARELLQQAVRENVLTVEAAELIEVTRLLDVPLAAYARRCGLPEDRLRKRRKVAEERLATAIGSGQVHAMSPGWVSGSDR